jgi:hypothetical protein
MRCDIEWVDAERLRTVLRETGGGEACCFDADDCVWRAAWISSPEDQDMEPASPVSGSLDHS